MAGYLNDAGAAQANSIPLLDASSLPSADDWTLLESINDHADEWSEFEPEFDRCGRIRVRASYDE